MERKEYNLILANNLKKCMAEYNLNQVELAQIMGVSKGMLTFYLDGTNSPRMDKVDKLCEHFDLPRSYFLEKRIDSPSDIKKEPASEIQKQLISLMADLSDSELAVLLSTAQSLTALHKSQDSR
jgi:transcriptional regulator with XRE-family HTH domain